MLEVERMMALTSAENMAASKAVVCSSISENKLSQHLDGVVSRASLKEPFIQSYPIRSLRRM